MFKRFEMFGLLNISNLLNFSNISNPFQIIEFRSTSPPVPPSFRPIRSSANFEQTTADGGCVAYLTRGAAPSSLYPGLLTFNPSGVGYERRSILWSKTLRLRSGTSSIFTFSHFHSAHHLISTSTHYHFPFFTGFSLNK